MADRPAYEALVEAGVVVPGPDLGDPTYRLVYDRLVTP